METLHVERPVEHQQDLVARRMSLPQVRMDILGRFDPRHTQQMSIGKTQQFVLARTGTQHACRSLDRQVDQGAERSVLV